MSLFLSHAGLDPVDIHTFQSLVFQHQHELQSQWICVDDLQQPSFFEPHALLFSNSELGLAAYKKHLHSSCFFIVAPSLAHPHKPPQDVSVRLRLPFLAPPIIQLLNDISQQIYRLTGPKIHQQPLKEELVDFKFNITKLERVPSILIYLFAIFQQKQPNAIFRIRRISQKLAGSFDIFCFPDRRQIASTLLYPDLLSKLLHPDHHGNQYEITRITPQDRIQFEHFLAPTFQSADSFLWTLGFKALKTSDLLPWIRSDQYLQLTEWPQLALPLRSPFILRTLHLLFQQPMTLADLIQTLQCKRKEACDIINALLIMGLLTSKKPTPLQPALSLPYSECETILHHLQSRLSSRG